MIVIWGLVVSKRESKREKFNIEIFYEDSYYFYSIRFITQNRNTI